MIKKEKGRAQCMTFDYPYFIPHGFSFKSVKNNSWQKLETKWTSLTESWSGPFPHNRFKYSNASLFQYATVCNHFQQRKHQNNEINRKAERASCHVLKPERPVNPLFPRTRQINLLHKRYAIQQNRSNGRATLPDSVQFQTYKKTECTDQV